MKYFQKIGFWVILVLFFSACGTTTTIPHKINIAAIEANRDNVFKLGIVKVEGRPLSLSLSKDEDEVQNKITALERIPIYEICDILSNKYGLQISTEVNKTVKIVEEDLPVSSKGRGMRPQSGIHVQVSPKCQNPYWGNVEYRKTSYWEGLKSGNSFVIDKQGVSNLVNITYGFSSSAGIRSTKELIYYIITIESKDDILVRHKGEIATIKTPKKGLFESNAEGIWNSFISHADKIDEALARDL